MDKFVYVASRASLPDRVEMWKRLIREGMRINSTWIHEAGPGQTKSHAELWARIHNEIGRSCGVIFYAEELDFPLKGAYVEAGIALGMGKSVKVVMPNSLQVLLDPDLRPIGSWITHPLVTLDTNVYTAYFELTGHDLLKS